MFLPHLRTRHAAALALICGACTLLVLVPMLAQALYRHGVVPQPWRDPFLPLLRAEWRTSLYLQLYGRAGHLPANVVFLPIDSASTTLSDVPPEELSGSPALQLMARGFPFPREVYPLIIKRLCDAGAKVVAFDMRFPNEREGDEPFRAALEKYAAHVVIGSNFITSEEGTNRPGLEMPSRSLIPSGDIGDPRLGFVNFRMEEEDSLVRYAFYRTTLSEYFGQPEFPPELWSLSAQVARKAGFEPLVPAEHRSWMIRFVPTDQLHAVSLHDIFSDRLWAHPPFNHGALFKDKIVFIGPYGNWIKDELETPFGPMLGPQIHLSALASVLNRDFLTDSSPEVDLLLILLAGGVAWLASLLVKHPLYRSALYLLLAALYVTAAFLLFNLTGYSLKLLSPNLALLASGGLGLVWERLAEQAERLRVRRTLERYVSRDVVKEVLDNPQSFLHTLGGERRPISILFSDVRGFTTLTESADAALLVRQLNEYFTEMVRLVFAHHGTLDKFIGDAVMASWGGIVTRGPAEDARSAVAAALQMLDSLQRLNAGWKERGLLELKIGVGVNHGEAICGHLGSEEKQEFSAIGDAVNLASRLEGATKEFHVDLLLGENTAALVRDSFTLRTVDLLQVKGKTKPVEVFTVLDEPPPAWLERYEEGIRLYRARAFPAAESAFTAAARSRPEDWLIHEYLRRTRAYLADPPPADWDGVYVMTKK